MSSFIRTIRKLFVSAFVVVTFVAYALHERFVHPNANIDAAGSAPVAAITRQIPSAQIRLATPTSTTPAQALASTSTNQEPADIATATPDQLVLVPTPTPPTLPTPTDQPLPTPTESANGLYKDGTYTGAEANAYYGWVQVEAVIQNGQIADVQFVEYPQDRRTSQRINSRAVPALQTEAVQAQSANVDMISGATLTSRAFIESLQSALDAAKGQQS